MVRVETNGAADSNFYYSFFFLPRPQREAILAVYAFCREVDDIVDLPAGRRDASLPADLLRGWRQEIGRLYDRCPNHPLAWRLAPVIEAFGLSRAYFEGILEGVSMDLQKMRYATFQELERYCYHVAGEVGLLCMEIFGCRSDRMKQYAMALGTAFQLTNILRDVATDADRGRIYLPQEDLERFGVVEQQLLEGDPSGGYRELMAFQAQRARDYYQRAASLITPAERKTLMAPEVMRGVYYRILEKIEARRYDVFSHRVRVPAWEKIGIAVKTWWDLRWM